MTDLIVVALILAFMFAFIALIWWIEGGEFWTGDDE
jgi:hypothetical protein